MKALLMLLAFQVLPPPASAQENPKPGPTYKSCAASFSLERQYTSLKKVVSNPEMQRLLLTQAACQAMKTRSASSCTTLKVIRGNAEATCRGSFSELVLWRDLARNDRKSEIDELDLETCRKWSANVTGSPRSAGAFCTIISNAYAQRQPLCRAIFENAKSLATPEKIAQGPARCETQLKSFERKITNRERNFTDVSNAVISRLWTGQPSSCEGAYPFDAEDPGAQGLCFGIFEPTKCDALAGQIKDVYCKSFP